MNSATIDESTCFSAYEFNRYASTVANTMA